MEVVYSRSEKFSEYWKLKLETELRARKYSYRTRGAYEYYNCLLCRTIQKSPEEITEDDITQFLADMEENKAYSASSMNLAISAIKFFYKKILKKNIANERHRPRQDRRLPMVLSKTEIIAMLAAEKNLKHRLLLMLVYASGLRVSEVVSLRRRDIDIDRKSLIIVAGKGRKDRYSIVAENAIATLTSYYSQYGDSEWVFPSYDPGKHLSIRTAQRIFEVAMEKAHIRKNATIHSLRHSFATHLLESGTNIRYIQELLGHNSIRTTERYTHVAHCKISKVVSPLDTLHNEELD